jgi:hypothetical protein
MFVLTALVYPVVLALLCLGTGLLVDRASGGVLPAMLLLTTGLAALVVASQLTTYVAPIAPVTPYVLVAVALAGLMLGWGRATALVRSWRTSCWQVGLVAVAYLLALAPVLFAGRPSFSSYLALADSAVHMVGADFLIRHGQDYAHLDLANSYGATIDNYYNASYPSGADSLLGGTSFLTGLPLIWTFQPFTAFMLATATGPAWVLARRVGLDGAWAAAAALTMTVPALVYAYELIGSIKEIVALALILSMGALVVEHRRWLWKGMRGAIPFALIAGAGVGALGVAFGTWTLAAVAVLVIVAIAELGKTRGRGAQHDAPVVPAPAQPDVLGAGPPRESEPGAQSAPRLAGLLVAGALVLLIGAWPTWTNLSGSVTVAQGIASTSNPGNLHSPLHPTQLLGVWLGGSYKLLPAGLGLTLTSVLIALLLLAVLSGLGNLVRTRRYELALWFALTLVLWLVVRVYATTWADAKALMLTSPVVVLIAWAGIAALWTSGALAPRILAPLLALALLGGVLASDTLQYKASNLAPTARYDELASIDTRFAGRGPTLFTDFDEYALYELHDLDVGGPDFVYPPPALAGAAGGHGHPVQLNRIAPAKLAAYPLIVMRRDPLAVRPPAAYRLLWQGVYYQVWGRRPGARPALAHLAVSAPLMAVMSVSVPSDRSASAATLTRTVPLHISSRSGSAPMPVGSASPRARCLRVVERLARRARTGQLVAAVAPRVLNVEIPRSRLYRPPGWARVGRRILMRRPGTMQLSFRLPHGGLWQLWLQGDVMRALHVAVDGRALGSLGAQLGGNSLVLDTLSPLPARLSAGAHTLTISRPAGSLAPGDGGAAVLDGIYLTPAGPAGRPSLETVALAQRYSLCARPPQWVEVLPRR